MTTLCPCCRAPLRPEAIAVSLDTNSIAVGWSDTVIALTGPEAELLEMLAAVSPGAVTRDRIIARLWPSSEKRLAIGNLKVRVTLLRPRLRPLGLQLENIWGHGYRLMRRRETAADREQARLAARAKEPAHA